MQMDLAWWIAVIGVPLCVGILAYVRSVQSDSKASISKLHERVDAAEKDNASYRLQAAQMFATMSSMSALDRRLSDTLQRIDTKLDRLIERNVEKDRP